MGVKPGGCSGYSYEMFFDTDKFDGDVIEEYNGVNIVVESKPRTYQRCNSRLQGRINGNRFLH